MCDQVVVVFSIWCAVFAIVKSQQPCHSKVFEKPEVVLACEQRVQNITTGNNPNYNQQVNNLEALNERVQDWVGGDLSDEAQAEYNPVFYMHHAFIDFIWVKFRRRQSSLKCRVNVEKDYQEPGDNAVENFSGHAPLGEMHGFEYLQNRDGVWRNWTTAVYVYEPAPKCPECAYSENLYCDMDVDLRRPEGVCGTKTKFFCVDPPFVGFDRDKPYEEPLVGGATFILGPIQKRLPGDGRTVFMSQEEGIAILRRQPTHRRKHYRQRKASTGR